MAEKRGTDDDTLREWTFDDDLPDEYVMKGHKPAKQRGNVVDIETREPVKTVVNKTAYTNAFALGCRDRLRPHHAYSWSHGWRHRNNGELWTDDPEGLTLLAELSEMIGTNKKLMPSASPGDPASPSAPARRLGQPASHEIALPDHRIYNLDTGEVRDAQAPTTSHTRRLGAVPVKGPHLNMGQSASTTSAETTPRNCGCRLGAVTASPDTSTRGIGSCSYPDPATAARARCSPPSPASPVATTAAYPPTRSPATGTSNGSPGSTGHASEPSSNYPPTAWRKIEVLKGLVAGDPMTANFMRRNSFDFKPVIKLMIAGNTRPRLPGGDSGLRRRMVNIHVPEVTETDRDPILTDTARRQELPAITAWAAAKAHGIYVTNGLPDIPDRWAEETRQYLDDEDEMGQWINTRIAITTNGFTPSTQLREAYEKDTGHQTQIGHTDHKRAPQPWHRHH